jgi:hypothetical protein
MKDVERTTRVRAKYCHVLSDYRRVLDCQLDLLDHTQLHAVTVYIVWRLYRRVLDCQLDLLDHTPLHTITVYIVWRLYRRVSDCQLDLLDHTPLHTTESLIITTDSHN